MSSKLFSGFLCVVFAEKDMFCRVSPLLGSEDWPAVLYAFGVVGFPGKPGSVSRGVRITLLLMLPFKATSVRPAWGDPKALT